MTSLLVEPLAAELEGAVEPRILSVPSSAVTSAAGDEAVELAAMAGLFLDPWQQFVLRQAMAEDAAGKWAAFEVGLVVSRQNGKGSILEARELAGLFLLGERLLIHSAHLFDTAMEHFRRILELIESTPDFDGRVKRISRSHGDEGIELKNGQRLRFKTRTKSGGRGLSGDFVALDEAMILDAAAVSALMPTMAAKAKHGNPQIWYTGSAGDDNAHVLAKIRRRGLSGSDPSLAYLEYSVDEFTYRDDPERVAVDPRAIATANPSLNLRLTLEHTLREQRSMDRAEYAKERLGVGNWPPDVDEDWEIPKDVWLGLADRSDAPPKPTGAVAFALDTMPNRERTSISVAGKRLDGLPQVQLVENRAGVTWTVARLVELKATNPGCVIAIDNASPAASLKDDLEAANLEVVWLDTPEAKQAFGQFFDAATDGNLRHLDQSELNAALKGASTRMVGDGKLWDRKSTDVDITSLVSCTNALWAWATQSDAPPNIW